MIPVRSRAVLQIGLLLLLVSAAAKAQNTIHVPADQPTIQAGINAASPGDTVLVAPGTYVENINFNGKAITVTSSNGAASTIIDGNAAGTVVTFNQNESAGALLNGFTIRNGRALNGAGIYIVAASPTIINNVITGNGGIDGAGILVAKGAPLIQGNTVTSNFQSGGSGWGAAIHITGSNGLTSKTSLIGNTITNNHFDGGSSGGGISVDSASVLIQNNYISGNSAYNGGAGIFAESSGLVTIIGNVITNNHSGGGGDGGGFYDQNNGPLLFLNNTLYGNSSL